jgi:hypothetical protein
VNENIVNKTRKIGRSNLYILNDTENIRGLVQYVVDTVNVEYENASKSF